MIYAERVTESNEIEKAVFFSVSEFVPYRALGWIATPEYNEAADKEIKRVASLSDTVLKYLAPIISMQTERWELGRRKL